MATQKFKFAGIQLLVSDDKMKNLENAKSKIAEAASNGARVISLPECFNCPYSNDSFPVHCEPTEPGNPSYDMLQKAAKDHKIVLIGGSIPEKAPDSKLYNTSLIFSPTGQLLAKHRKVHLFDIDIPGGITFIESKTLSPGNEITTFDTEFCKMGVAICYDMRFAELALLSASKGCKMLVYPGAFNMTTGPMHWELLQRARALDCQIFVATVSPARNTSGGGYQAWGHSSVCSPWGKVIATTEHEPDIVYSEIDLQEVEKIRAQIPVTSQKRKDLYQVVGK